MVWCRDSKALLFRIYSVASTKTLACSLPPPPPSHSYCVRCLSIRFETLISYLLSLFMVIVFFCSIILWVVFQNRSIGWIRVSKAMFFFFLMSAKMTLYFLLWSDFCSQILLASTNFWDIDDFDIVWVTGTMAVPLLKKQIVKKRVKQFKRPQSDRKICVKVWISGSINFFCLYLFLNAWVMSLKFKCMYGCLKCPSNFCLDISLRMMWPLVCCFGC